MNASSAPGAASEPPEVWLRGPVEGVAAPLQPVVHSLLQVGEEMDRLLPSLGADALLARPGGAASTSFHVRHMLGSLDRLLTYAEGRQLSDAQRAAMADERSEPPLDGATLRDRVRAAIDDAIDRVRRMPVAELEARRLVGRGALPSTLLGLLVHAAEHTQRHAGQAVTTAKIARGLRDGAAG